MQSNNPPNSQGDSNNAQHLYRSRVRSLLGIPGAGSGSMAMGRTPPPVGFQYPNAPSADMFSMSHAPTQSFIVETANPMAGSHAMDSDSTLPQSPAEDLAQAGPRPSQQESGQIEVQERAHQEQAGLNEVSLSSPIDASISVPVSERQPQQRTPRSADPKPFAQTDDPSDAIVAEQHQAVPTYSQQEAAQIEVQERAHQEQAGLNEVSSSSPIDASISVPVSERQVQQQKPRLTDSKPFAQTDDPSDAIASEQHRNEPLSDSIESHEIASVDMPSPVRQQEDGSVSGEVQRTEERSGGFDTQQNAVEQSSQLDDAVQQFDIDMPGVSEMPQSFPALAEVSKDNPTPEHQPQQEPRLTDSVPVEGVGDSKVDIQVTDQIAESPSTREVRSGAPQSLVQRAPRSAEGASLPVQQSPHDSGVVEQTARVAPNRQRADVVEQGAAEIGQGIEHVSPAGSSQARNLSTNVDTSTAVNRDDAIQQPESMPVESLARPNVPPAEANGVSDVQYIQTGGVNQSYEETLDQIEQIRNSMQQLAAKTSTQSQKNEREQRHEEPPRYVYPPPQPVVIYQRPASRASAPRAFWERRYLSRLRLRTLR